LITAAKPAMQQAPDYAPQNEGDSQKQKNLNNFHYIVLVPPKHEAIS